MYTVPTEARKGHQIPPDLELQMSVSLHVGTGTEPESSGRAVNAQTTEPPLLPLGDIFSHSHMKMPRSQQDPRGCQQQRPGCGQPLALGGGHLLPSPLRKTTKLGAVRRDREHCTGLLSRTHFPILRNEIKPNKFNLSSYLDLTVT